MAITSRLRDEAKESLWELSELQRQYAYDQLVERLYRVDDGWVIKGAAALLARRLSVRHTIDIDIHHAGAIADVERQVRRAAELDIGDWMRFEVGRSVRVKAAGAAGVQAKVASYIGTKVWTSFQIDIVADGIVMIGQPDTVRPLTSIDSTRRDWWAYPLVDHVADKVCAIFERHSGLPSTRFKDLVDLVAIAARASVDASTQVEALATEIERRGLRMPHRFDVPDRTLWENGYEAEARRTVGFQVHSVDAALAVVCPFIDPLLDRTASGRWNPDQARWEALA